jgi:predicted DNA repair protein MutK
MATGLLALLDDVAAIAKTAAATLDDVAGQAARAGVKASGVVIDDAAVTPTYVVGFAAERELPIVWKIAVGSIRNKLLILLPLALLLSVFAPFLMTPLLTLGGLFLCYEGTEKVFEALFPHAAHKHEHAVHATTDPRVLEDQRVNGAIKTDFILSAEIIAITLAAIEEPSIWLQAAILAVVSIGITVLVYGAVALIVKADDVGVALAHKDRNAASRAVGRAIVAGMPVLLRLLSIVGTAAMIWVGGALVLHGVEEFGWHAPADLVHDWAAGVAHAVGWAEGFVEWLVSAALSLVIGLVVGAILIPIVEYIVAPLVRTAMAPFRRSTPAH